VRGDAGGARRQDLPPGKRRGLGRVVRLAKKSSSKAAAAKRPTQDELPRGFGCINRGEVSSPEEAGESPAAE
jgi:hypothetical protein